MDKRNTLWRKYWTIELTSVTRRSNIMLAGKAIQHPRINGSTSKTFMPQNYLQNINVPRGLQLFKPSTFPLKSSSSSDTTHSHNNTLSTLQPFRSYSPQLYHAVYRALIQQRLHQLLRPLFLHVYLLCLRHCLNASRLSNVAPPRTSVTST